MQSLIQSVQTDLRRRADPANRDKMRNLYNMDVTHYWGVRAPAIREVAAKHYPQVKERSMAEALKLCEQLLETRNWEQKIVAFDWAYRRRKSYDPKHFALFERWLKRYVNDWGDCDDFCTHALGDFLVQYPEFIPRVKSWTASKNRWLRRASAVSLIPGARRGLRLEDGLDVADRLLLDQDDLVQKGYGWMLKEFTKRYPDDIFDYVMKHRGDMPRTALRYAIEKLPPARKKQAMQRDRRNS
jgi:3-methyladenine DNA glycosylase AlkD